MKQARVKDGSNINFNSKKELIHNNLNYSHISELIHNNDLIINDTMKQERLE